MDQTPAAAFSQADLGSALAQCAAYADQFGWGSPDVLFALVPTALLAAQQPELVDEHDTSALSPVVQELDGDADVSTVLATLAWPDAVVGCALATEISIVPPDPEGGDAAPGAEPRTARLIAGALRNGVTTALLAVAPDGSEGDGVLRTHPDLAVELRQALAATF
ncbi:MAG: PPA1309 family protein [Gordonia sp. (in: high G+C Gram-positive bacteria)]